MWRRAIIILLVWIFFDVVMSDNRMLEVINEEGNVIGQETRERIHKEGLLHREIRIWFCTPDGSIIFQHRAKDKDTFPDLLDATVGGHVEIGHDFPDTALEEIAEETGVAPDESALSLVRMVKSASKDEVTGTTNNVLRAIYTYRFDGTLSDLMVEDGKGLGFEAWPIETILDISEEDRRRFIPDILKNESREIFLSLQKGLHE